MFFFAIGITRCANGDLVVTLLPGSYGIGEPLVGPTGFSPIRYNPLMLSARRNVRGEMKFCSDWARI